MRRPAALQPAPPQRRHLVHLARPTSTTTRPLARPTAHLLVRRRLERPAVPVRQQAPQRRHRLSRPSLPRRLLHPPPPQRRCRRASRGAAAARRRLRVHQPVSGRDELPQARPRRVRPRLSGSRGWRCALLSLPLSATDRPRADFSSCTQSYATQARCRYRSTRKRCASTRHPATSFTPRRPARADDETRRRATGLTRSCGRRSSSSTLPRASSWTSAEEGRSSTRASGIGSSRSRRATFGGGRTCSCGSAFQPSSCSTGRRENQRARAAPPRCCSW